MALDKVIDSAALDAGMIAVADAIRAKAGTIDPLAWPDGFAAAISGIETGGPTGVTDSVVSVAFSATNALEARTGFNEIVPGDAKIAIYYFQGDLSNAPNNQCLVAAFPRVYEKSNMMYCRWRNGSNEMQTANSMQYDLVVNAGDTYRMVVIR